jgi:hypothetical protein
MRFGTIDCTSASTDENNVALSGGVAESSTFTTVAGFLSYKVHYDGNTTYNESTGVCEPLTIQKFNSTTGTEIHNPNHGIVTSVPVGTMVHDKATVSGSGPTPTGTVDFARYTNGSCDGTAANTENNVVLSSGSAESSGFTTIVGSMSYKAHYDGDGNYSPNDGDCEPLTVSKLNSYVATHVHNSAHADITNTIVIPGTVVHDNASVSGPGPTPTGTADFKRYANTNCTGDSVEENNVALVGGVAESSTFVAVPGSLGYIVHYDGDSMYNPSDGVCEPLNVSKLDSQVATQVHNPSHTDVTNAAVEAGTVVHDQATVSSATTGPTPTGTVDFMRFATNDCTLTSTDQNNITLTSGVAESSNYATPGAGFLSYKVHYDGDATYNESTGVCEPLRMVDANITIGPDGTNDVNVNHTFTVTVMKDNGTGLVAASGEHVGFTLTNSGGATAVVNTSLSSCDDAGPNTNASGQCVIVFTSATAGQTIGNASVTLSVNGVSLTRDTNPATVIIPAGPGGSGPATKTWNQPGGQYCSPGYWKQTQHFDSWVTYAPGQTFSSVFGRPITIMWSAGGKPQPLTNPTLLQALQANGSGMSLLARVAVDALLNSTSMNSGFTAAQVISAVQQAIDTNNMSLLNQFTIPENCPLN